MLNFIRQHWFGFLISAVFCLFLAQFFIVLIAPHHDLQNRGFAPCTETMSKQVSDCAGNKFCVLKAVAANTFCDTAVIGQGLKNWVSGEQERPWSNYLYIPEYPQDEPDEGLEEYYESNPDIAKQMLELKNKNEELENMKNEN